MTCAVADCDRKAWRGELCRGHWQRKQRGQPLTGELREYVRGGRGPRTLFWDAVLDLHDVPATDDEGWRKARQRIEVYGRMLFGRRRVRKL